MNRKILLIEPNYKNKYPPMGLMKIATYYRQCQDDVRFSKGDLKEFAARLLCEEFYSDVQDISLGKYFPKLIEFIKSGKYAALEAIPNFRGGEYEDKIKAYRLRYKVNDFPLFDVVGITTLFTFYWKQTVDTINFAKKFCKPDGKILVGGIASTILPDHIFQETGIHPHEGLLDEPGVLDAGDDKIIDELPLDYSILDEIDYEYPANNAYLGYMTRGCPRKCSFCAVSRLEPKYKNYISMKNQIRYIEEHFGAQKDLLLMDNNVFASNCFDKIIDEIKECGFGKDATYVPPNEYEIAIKNLRENYNPRAYIRKIIKIYDKLTAKLSETESGAFYQAREKCGLLYAETATTAEILAFDGIVHPMYNKTVKKMKRVRYIDFNQGVDARLVTDAKMKKLEEINIRPLRIAFDHYEQKDIYIEAIKIAATHGIMNLSNYLLYNYEDKPEDLYYRMKINVDLCEELGVTIYSFPMKFHPIDDPAYFRNRDFIGEHWNRKFIRAIQAVLNATKGKVGRGKSFFEEAFGKDIESFMDILWMPEALIIYRFKYKDNLTVAWRDKFNALSTTQLDVAKTIIARNSFTDADIMPCNDPEIQAVLEYYRIRRDAE
ncbi:MAG: hypothetical protein RSE40_06505 [Hydrogenoanaerobacterium sp.]